MLLSHVIRSRGPKVTFSMHKNISGSMVGVLVANHRELMHN